MKKKQQKATVRVVGGQTIATRYLAPTETRPARIKAHCHAGSWTISRYADDTPDDFEEAHAYAARLLVEELGWGGEWVGGAPTRGLDHYIFVQIDRDKRGSK